MRRRSDERGEQPVASTTDVSYSTSALSRARRRGLRPTTAVQSLHPPTVRSASFCRLLFSPTKTAASSPPSTDFAACCSDDDIAAPVVFTKIDGAT